MGLGIAGIAGLLQTLVGGGLGLAGLGQAGAMRDKIWGMVKEPALGMAKPEARQAGRDLSGLGLSGELGKQLFGGQGGIPAYLTLLDQQRAQQLQEQMFGGALSTLQGMPTDPFSERTRRMMIEGSVGQVNQAGQSAIQAARQSAASRGMGQGRWLGNRLINLGMQTGAERAGAIRQIDITRNLQQNLNKIQQAQSIANLYATRQIPTIDFGSIFSPQLQFPFQQANAYLGASSPLLQMTSGLAQGLIGGGSQMLSAASTPTPSQPSPGWGLAGSLGGAGIMATGMMLSDRFAKADIEAVNVQEVLDQLDDLPVSRWHYRADQTQHKHIGPMAQDFRRAFGIGSDRYIHAIDAIGVCLAAIKALKQRVEDLEEENRVLHRESRAA